MKPHVHSELIKAWADGADIEVFGRFNSTWIPVYEPVWNDNQQYRIKPREFPKTSLSGRDLWDIYVDTSKDTTINSKIPPGMGLVEACCSAIANAAIKQYILDEENKASLLATQAKNVSAS